MSSLVGSTARDLCQRCFHFLFPIRLPPKNNVPVEPRYDNEGRLLPTPEPPLDDSRVEAQHNWWGSDLMYFVAGRIRDRRHDRYLVEVNWEPYYPYNTSVLEGV